VLWAYVEHGANILGGEDSAEAARPEFELMVAKHGAAAERDRLRFGSTWWTRWVPSRHRFAGLRFRAAVTYTQGAISDRSPGDLVRAVGALGSERVWQGARVIGLPHAPPWLAELTAQTSEQRPPDHGAA
jgi:hypothetical protein